MGLNYKGHVFDARSNCTCCIGDAQQGLRDPTQTGLIRSKFRSSMGIAWRQIIIATRKMLVTNDILGFKETSLVSAVAGGSSKLQLFERWFSAALDKAILGQDIKSYIRRAYENGQAFAQAHLGSSDVSPLAQDRQDTLNQLAVSELSGIVQAVTQQTIRAVAQGILINSKPAVIAKYVATVIDKVGVNRTNSLIELIVVRAHAEATLDVYEAYGIATVGLVPETYKKGVSVGDAKGGSGSRRKGPGSRIPKTRPPSQRTISRIRAAEIATAKALGEMINVRTAGDDNVCPECESIAEGNPYNTNEARSLIPAHPSCRCVFVPAGDRRFAPDHHPQP